MIKDIINGFKYGYPYCYILFFISLWKIPWVKSQRWKKGRDGPGFVRCPLCRLLGRGIDAYRYYPSFKVPCDKCGHLMELKAKTKKSLSNSLKKKKFVNPTQTKETAMDKWKNLLEDLHKEKNKLLDLGIVIDIADIVPFLERAKKIGQKEADDLWKSLI